MSSLILSKKLEADLNAFSASFFVEKS